MDQGCVPLVFLLDVADEPGMVRTRPCLCCKCPVSKHARACPSCGHPLKSSGNPVALAVIMLGTLGGMLAMAIPREEEGGQAQPHSQPASVPAATDDQIVTAIRGSDDLEQHRLALVAASRAFMATGGTLADLREMGGWGRSQAHKPRSVYFTYKRPGTNVRDRWYYDVDRSQLFQ